MVSSTVSVLEAVSPESVSLVQFNLQEPLNTCVTCFFCCERNKFTMSENESKASYNMSTVEKSGYVPNIPVRNAKKLKTQT